MEEKGRSTVTSNRLLFLRHGKCFFSISGERVCELSDPNLDKVDEISTISVSGNKLVMACGKSGILKFKIS